MDRVLIVADSSERCVATPRGLELAAKLKQHAEVVAFVHAPLSAIGKSKAQQEAAKKRLLAARKKDAQERIDKYKSPGQKIELEVIWSKDPVGWVSKECRSKKFVWVVKTGRAKASRVRGSSDWQLLRECPAPVLIVAEKRWHRTKPVLAALDLATTVARKQALNKKILSVAQALAETLNVDLKIITAIEVPALLQDLDLVDPRTYEIEAKESMQPQIDKLAAEFDLPELAFSCKRGPVEKVITSRAAKVRAQVVVMGTVGRKGVRARLLGNVAEQVLRHLKTDVLALKP